MRPHLYTIPPDAFFIEQLAKGLWERAEKDPFRLAEMYVLLPTRRACRLLHEIFGSIIGRRALLLPRIEPLGDLDEEEIYFSTSTEDAFSVAPAISPLRRQLLLAQLIRQKDQSIPFDQAVQLGEALGRFLDEVQIERLSFSALEKLVPENLAIHWQQTLKFLSILTEHWPNLLAVEGGIDAAQRQNLFLEAQIKRWKEDPPSFPIIAAGSTGSRPATADLLDLIASLPEGAVILPGLDQDLDEGAWQAVKESHPQFGMKRTLEKMKVERKEVLVWGETKPASRVRLLQESMRPAEVTDGWRTLDPGLIAKDCLKGLSLITLDTLQSEALTIALMLRHALEDEKKTASLVTGDRDLAERVAGELKRWDIEANDSAGISLASTPVGSFMLHVLAASNAKATSLDYLSLLKHPLAALGLDPALCRSFARQLEREIWRNEEGDTTHLFEAIQWFEQFQATLAPLALTWDKEDSFQNWIEKHRDLTILLATSHDLSGPDRLFRGADGEKAALWMEELIEAAHGFPPLKGSDYTRLFAALIRDVTVRPSFGQHPRLSILGPLEARLQQCDLIILGGLNEGSWPPEAAIDPWMSRPMKEQFGLPLPERRIGLSAHDFVQLASAPEVVLTRSRRIGNAPAVPSRFLLQLETVLAAVMPASAGHFLISQSPFNDWAMRLDEPETVQASKPPEPRPPLAFRPKKLSVTEIGTWLRNPYAIYARHILKLKKLGALEIMPSVADKGSLIHAILERFMASKPLPLPQNALDQLLELGVELFAPFRQTPEVMAFWWPRFRRIAEWFIAYQREREKEQISCVQAEAVGEITIGHNFSLKGRADRIDRLKDGRYVIIDYKTGSVPSQAEIRSGIEPQLALLAFICGQGGFKGVTAKEVAGLSYWKLTGGTPAGEEISVKEPIADLIETAFKGLSTLIERFADETMPYRAVPKPLLQPRFDDYAHLARLAEWGRTAEDA